MVSAGQEFKSSSVGGPGAGMGCGCGLIGRLGRGRTTHFHGGLRPLLGCWWWLSAGGFSPFPSGPKETSLIQSQPVILNPFLQFRYTPTIHTNYIIRRNMTALIFNCQNFGVINSKNRDFPGDAMDRNSPARAGDVGLSPGLGRFHTPCNSWACGPQLVSPRSATGETTAVRSPHHNEEQPLLAATGRRPVPSTENPVPP